MAKGARLLIECGIKSITEGSNPSGSAIGEKMTLDNVAEDFKKAGLEVFLITCKEEANDIKDRFPEYFYKKLVDALPCYKVKIDDSYFLLYKYEMIKFGIWLDESLYTEGTYSQNIDKLIFKHKSLLYLLHYFEYTKYGNLNLE